MNPSTSAPMVGAVLEDRYELVRHIARGGMGDVFEARDRLLQRDVAVKVFRSTSPVDRARFEAEITTLAALSHPGLVQVYDAGEHHGDGFVVLELVDGPNLGAILDQRGALPPREVAGLGAQVAAALAYVHDNGVVHRDVTPANVLCGPDGRPRLADFGIARLLDTSRITAVASTVGTAAYMAPEQVEGHDVRPAADVYALGLVLLEALTGRPAFAGPVAEVAVARLVQAPDVGAAPAPWQPLLGEMTTREPQARPPAAAVATRLSALAQGAPVAPAVDGHATTAAFPVGGGTAVMPAAMALGAPVPAPRSSDPPAGSRRALWVALAVVAVLVWAGLASRHDSAFDVPAVDTSETVVATTVPTTLTTAPPSTTAPPATAAPPPEHGHPSDNGKGNKGNKGKGEDD